MSRNNSRGSPTVIGPLTEVRPMARSRFVDARRLGLPIKQPPRAESEDNKDPDQHEQCFPLPLRLNPPGRTAFVLPHCKMQCQGLAGSRTPRSGRIATACQTALGLFAGAI